MLQDPRGADGSRLACEDLAGRSSSTTLGSVQVRLASLEDIVASKRYADRDKDREALLELERLLRDPDA